MTETTQLPKLDDITGAVRDHFQSDRSILSFQEYYEVVLKEPKAQLRSSAQYIKDMFDYFGHYDVVRPTGRFDDFVSSTLNLMGAGPRSWSRRSPK